MFQTHFIEPINSAISPFDFEIRSTIPQIPSDDESRLTPPERVFAVVNTTSDSITQLSTTHTAEEIAYLKRILDAMFDTVDSRRQEFFCLTPIQAIDLARPSRSAPSSSQAAESNQGLTKMEAQRTLEAFISEGWLEQSSSTNRYIRLSPRALMELRTWLVDTYNTVSNEDEDGEEEDENMIKFCFGCKDIVIIGQRCSDLNCKARLHHFCARNALRAARQQGGRANGQEGDKCPLCRKDWTGDHLVGEGAVRFPEGNSRRRTTGNGSRAENGRRSMVNGSGRGNDDQDSNEDGEEE